MGAFGASAGWVIPTAIAELVAYKNNEGYSNGFYLTGLFSLLGGAGLLALHHYVNGTAMPPAIGIVV